MKDTYLSIATTIDIECSTYLHREDIKTTESKFNGNNLREQISFQKHTNWYELNLKFAQEQCHYALVKVIWHSYSFSYIYPTESH